MVTFEIVQGPATMRLGTGTLTSSVLVKQLLCCCGLWYALMILLFQTF